MEITAALAADLALLGDAVHDPGTDSVAAITDTVLLVAASARAAVSSFFGLTVTVTAAGHDVEEPARVVLRFTLLDPATDWHDVETSLRLTRPTSDAEPGPPSVEVILFAATPGAFVDLAADLSFLTGHDFGAGDLDQHRFLAGERDITGVLQSETRINEAIGVLIARGRTPERASAELDALAAAADTDRVTEADRILTALTQENRGRTLDAPED